MGNRVTALVEEIAMLRAELRLALDALVRETQSTERHCEVCGISAPTDCNGEMVDEIAHKPDCPIGRLESLVAAQS